VTNEHLLEENNNYTDEGLLFEVYYNEGEDGEITNKNVVPRGKKKLIVGNKEMLERERLVFSQILASLN
jgi:hypothetical protein